MINTEIPRAKGVSADRELHRARCPLVWTLMRLRLGRPGAMENGMHPATLRQFEIAMMRGVSVDHPFMRCLSGPHHFHISKSVHDVAMQCANHEFAQSLKLRRDFQFPVTARCPCPVGMVLTVESASGTAVCILVDIDGKVALFSVGNAEFLGVGSFTPGAGFERMGVACGNLDAGFSALARLSMILSLINDPRIVDASPASGLDWSRQHRKAVEKVTGSAAMAFSVVSWKIGKRQKAIGTHLSEDGHPKALHWCRAHWRRAEEGQPKAEWVNIPRKGGWGWYCWAADCWKGHPDFGVKLQRHEPHLGEPRSRFVGSEQVLDSTRFAAMGAAQRAAMVEAGFAPSRSLH